MNILIGLIVGLVFFTSTISAYILGLKHSKQIALDIIPFTPLEEVTQKVAEVKQHFETKKQEEEIESVVEEYWR